MSRTTRECGAKRSLPEGDGQDGDEGPKGEMSEKTASMIIDAYWNGEAPKEIIRQEKHYPYGDVTKDW